jgi:hypothetical protein
LLSLSDGFLAATATARLLVLCAFVKISAENLLVSVRCCLPSRAAKEREREMLIFAILFISSSLSRRVCAQTVANSSRFFYFFAARERKREIRRGIYICLSAIAERQRHTVLLYTIYSGAADKSLTEKFNPNVQQKAREKLAKNISILIFYCT